MARSPKPSAHLVGNRVSSAMSKTEKVQEDIQLAEAELHLANEVVTGNLVAGGSQGDLARAVKHNALVEKKLQDAGEELQVVTDLLQSEENDRQRLEQDFADYRKADGSPPAGARSGAGSASVIEHLRELTRHKVAADHPVVRQQDGKADLPPA